MKDKDIDKLFREKLQDYEQQPPSFILENVLAGVAATRRKRIFLYWRVAGVAAALLLAFVAGWQVNHINQENLNQIVVVKQDSSPQTLKGIPSVPEKGTVENQISPADTSVRHRVPQFASAEDTPSTSRSKKLEPLAREMSQPEGHRGPLSATAEDTPLTSPDRIESLASTSIQEERKTLAEPLETISTDDSSLPQSPKAITPQVVSNNQLAGKLDEKKKETPVKDEQELTIDQQIMEQNQQQLQAQKAKGRKAHWLVGAQVSPAYSVNRSSHSAEYAGDMLNTSSNTPVELGGGLSVEYKPGKRWSLQSGVYYAGLGQSSRNGSQASRSLDSFAEAGSDYLNAPVNMDNSKMMINSQAGVIELKSIPTGLVVGNNLEDKSMTSAVVVSDARFIQNFQYIEIPLYLRYNVIDARFDVELMGGVSSNVLIGNDTYLESSSGKTLVGKTQDMQDINYSGTVGLGLKYGVSRRIFLNVEPRVKYYLHSLNTNSAVTYKPYTIGVYTGISYQF